MAIQRKTFVERHSAEITNDACGTDNACSVSDVEFAVSAIKTNAHKQSLLNIYASLSGIGASICECRHLDLLSPQLTTKFEADLIAWYHLFGTVQFKSGNTVEHYESSFNLKPLWHFTFISAMVDFDILELAIGREGTSITASTQEYVRSFISSTKLTRCLFHALYLQHLLVSTSMGSLINLHTPRILFSAAVLWYCYILYSSSTSQLIEPVLAIFPDDTFEALPEIGLLREEQCREVTNANQYLRTMQSLKRIFNGSPEDAKTTTLCVLESILRRLGTNGVSKTFADLVQGFIFGETEVKA